MSSENYLHIDSVDLHFPNDEEAKDEMKEVDITHKRTPKRILHFSDGTLEEYSSDEEDSVLIPKEPSTPSVDPTLLSWGPWFWYQTVLASMKLLAVCDYFGESLAHFFGITSPKYGYEIEQYNRQMAEDENLKREEDVEMAGWRPAEPTNNAPFVVQSQLKSTSSSSPPQNHQQRF